MLEDNSPHILQYIFPNKITLYFLRVERNVIEPVDAQVSTRKSPPNRLWVF